MMDVQTPLRRMLIDEDNDTAINFLDANMKDKNIIGQIGINTSKIKR